MKIEKKTGNVQTSGDLGEKKFTIAASAHAFEILSSKLYTDTVLAIVRELSTNAADAHVAAGHPHKPFGVHLPWYKEPYFEIRDFGTGLSHDDVMHVYTTYFDSTRNDSNEFTGALGLGSKSPFAYTDSFSVTSFHNGMKRCYSAFRSETGEPNIALLSEAQTNDPNGLEIRIEVKERDFDTFEDRAADVYEYFHVRPNFAGQRTLEFGPKDNILEGANWCMRYVGWGNQSLHIVMGNVRYNVALAKFKHSLATNGKLIITVPIGACNVAANREELHYDDNTVQNIQTILDGVFQEAHSTVRTALDACDNELTRIISRKHYAQVITLRGSDSIPLYQDDAYSSHELRVQGDKMYKKYAGGNIYPGDKQVYIFIENDVGEIKQSHKNAMRHWLSGQGSHRAYLVEIKSHTVFEDTFGKPAIKVSEVPAAPRRRGQSTGGSRCSIKQLRYAYRKMDSWINVDEKDVETKKAIAVRRKGCNVVFNGNEYEPSTIANLAAALGYEVVYGLPAKRYDKPREVLGLKDFETEARCRMKTLTQSGTPAQLARLQYSVGRYEYEMSSTLIEAIDGQGDVCDTAHDFMTEEQPESWRELCRMLNIEIPKVDNPIEALFKAYPLLTNVASNVSQQEIREYIQWKSRNS